MAFRCWGHGRNPRWREMISLFDIWCTLSDSVIGVLAKIELKLRGQITSSKESRTQRGKILYMLCRCYPRERKISAGGTLGPRRDHVFTKTLTLFSPPPRFSGHLSSFLGGPHVNITSSLFPPAHSLRFPPEKNGPPSSTSSIYIYSSSLKRTAVTHASLCCPLWRTAM